MNKYTYTPPCTREEMYAMYVEQNMSQKEIASKLGICLKPVQTAMRVFGIPARRQAKRDQRGSKNARWKGSQAGYQALHLRVATARGKPTYCEHCPQNSPSASYEWANVSGNYEDVMDYKRLCLSCHRKFDDSVLNLRKSA